MGAPDQPAPCRSTALGSASCLAHRAVVTGGIRSAHAILISWWAFRARDRLRRPPRRSSPPIATTGSRWWALARVFGARPGQLNCTGMGRIISRHESPRRKQKVNRLWLDQTMERPYVKLAQRGLSRREPLQAVEIDAQFGLIQPGHDGRRSGQRARRLEPVCAPAPVAGWRG